jgi:hypothetical protein
MPHERLYADIDLCRRRAGVSWQTMTRAFQVSPDLFSRMAHDRAELTARELAMFTRWLGRPAETYLELAPVTLPRTGRTSPQPRPFAPHHAFTDNRL